MTRQIPPHLAFYTLGKNQKAEQGTNGRLVHKDLHSNNYLFTLSSSTCLSSSSLEPTLVITVSVEGADGQLSKGVFLRMSLIDTNTPS